MVESVFGFQFVDFALHFGLYLKVNCVLLLGKHGDS
jgi:hypothetical protein